MNNLEKEIVKKLLGNLGIVYSNFGKVGITTKELFVEKLNFKNDLNEIESYNLYSGKILLDTGSAVKALLINMKDEIVLTFRMDAFPIHGITFLFSDEVGSFLVYDENNKWQQANLVTQLQALSGFEEMTQWGLIWQPLDNYEDLKEALITLVDN